MEHIPRTWPRRCMLLEGCLCLPRAHAQRGKVIGLVVVVVVVSTKIARSRILGEFASANCS